MGFLVLGVSSLLSCLSQKRSSEIGVRKAPIAAENSSSKAKKPSIPVFELAAQRSKFSVSAQSNDKKMIFQLSVCETQGQRCDPTRKNPKSFLGYLGGVRSSLSGSLEVSLRACSTGSERVCSGWSAPQRTTLAPSGRGQARLYQVKEAMEFKLLESCQKNRTFMREAYGVQRSKASLKASQKIIYERFPRSFAERST